MKLTLNSIFLGALLTISTFYSNTSYADGLKLTDCHGCDAKNTKSAALNVYEMLNMELVIQLIKHKKFI